LTGCKINYRSVHHMKEEEGGAQKPKTKARFVTTISVYLLAQTMRSLNY
jgi:hypothetical protein